jgi:hypothetical protein
VRPVRGLPILSSLTVHFTKVKEREATKIYPSRAVA